MSKSACALALLVSAVVLAAPVAAQEKKAEKKAAMRANKTLLENARVRVSESVFKPGEENPMEFRPYRINRVLKGSTTIERRHKDGKMEKLEWKEGGVYEAGPDTVSNRNIGKSEVTIFTVIVKQAK